MTDAWNLFADLVPRSAITAVVLFDFDWSKVFSATSRKNCRDTYSASPTLLFLSGLNRFEVASKLENFAFAYMHACPGQCTIY